MKYWSITRIIDYNYPLETRSNQTGPLFEEEAYTLRTPTHELGFKPNTFWFVPSVINNRQTGACSRSQETTRTICSDWLLD